MSRIKIAWYVYIVECSDGTLYIGVTTDVKRRIKEHNGLIQGAKYTKGRRPVKLAYFSRMRSKSQALRKECEMKKLSKKEKMDIINEA